MRLIGDRRELYVIVLCTPLLFGVLIGTSCNLPDSQVVDSGIGIESADHWTVRARQLISELETYEREIEPYGWIIGEGLSWDTILKEDWGRVEVALNEVGRITYRARITLWRLWLVTGRPPFLDMSSTQRDILEMLPQSIDGYKTFVATKGNLSEETIQVEGLLLAAGLIGTRYDLSGECYLQAQIQFNPPLLSVRPRGGPHIYIGGRGYPDPKDLDRGRRVRTAYESWVQRNRKVLKWDQRSRRFQAVGGGSVDPGELVDRYIEITAPPETWKSWQEKRMREKLSDERASRVEEE